MLGLQVSLARFDGHPCPSKRGNLKVPELESGPTAKITNSGTLFDDLPLMTMAKLHPDVSPGDFTVPPLEVAPRKLKSYAEFKEMKAAGAIPAGLRFQASIP